MSTEVTSSLEPGRDVDVEALHFIAAGLTALAGFDLAAISIVEGDHFRVVAVAGSGEASDELMALRSPIASVLGELAAADRTGRMLFLPQERAGDGLDGFSWVSDYRVLDAPDAWLPEDLLCALLYDADGALRGLLSVDLPVSRRRPGAAELEVLNVYARLAERAVVNFVEREQFATDLAFERRVSRYRSHLINVLSHDLQTPVTVILGQAELALESTTDQHSRDGLLAISRAAQRISAMSEDLLVMARVGDPDVPVDSAAVDVAGLAVEGVRLLGDLATGSDVELSVVVPAHPVYARGSAVELEALVSNLLSNAVKYSDPGGRVRVTVDQGVSGRVVLVVGDDGIGISAEDQRHLFDEFFRSASADVRARPGNGLGLAIVDRIIRRHHGLIGVESELSVGTTVRVELPAAAESGPLVHAFDRPRPPGA